MDESLGSIKTRTIRDRCYALKLAIERMLDRDRDSLAAQKVLLVTASALSALEKHVVDLVENGDLELLEDQEAEQALHLAGELLPYLYNILGLVEKTDVGSVPADLVASLRNEVRQYFEDAELIVVGSSSLNYSVIDLAVHLRAVFEQLGTEPPPALPRKILRISVPSAELNQALLHCVLAHEIGHALYADRYVKETIFPISVTLGANAAKDLVGTSLEDERSSSDEVRLRSSRTASIHRATHCWISEVASDFFGLHLFGPASFFASATLFVSARLLDVASLTHPPARLRLRAAMELMEVIYPNELFSPATLRFLDTWREIVNKPIPQLAEAEQITLNILEKDEVLQKIRTAVSASLREEERYSPQRYSADLESLLPLIDAHIPPVEVLVGGRYNVSNMVGILNSAWESYIDGLVGFRANLPRGESENDMLVSHRFNAFVLKAMELNEVVDKWERARS